MGLGATVVLVISGTRDRQGTDEGGGRQLKEGPTGRVGGSLTGGSRKSLDRGSLWSTGGLAIAMLDESL